MDAITHEKAVSLMEIALLEAMEGEAKGEVPVGAVIVSGQGQILARAHNSPIALKDPTAHAEILAIRQAAGVTGNYRLPGTCMFVTIEPCLMCAGALITARVERLFFGAREPRGGAFGSAIDINELPGLNHRIEVQEGLLAERCAGLLRLFFKKKRVAR